MDPVMLVEALDDHGQLLSHLRFAGAGAQCRIGRSVACDIVLDDGFAAPEHALLTLQPDGRVLVQDLGTRNGVRHQGQLIDADNGRLLSRGELIIGRTRLRVRTGAEPLAPELLFRRDVLRRHRTGLAIVGVSLCLLLAAFLVWTRAPEQLGQSVLLAVLAAIVVLAVWTGAWALVSRLAAGAWQVRIHLALAALTVAVWGWGFWLYTVAAFALQWRWLGAVMAVLAGVVAFVAAWRHLHYATRLPRAVAIAIALLVPALLGGTWWLIELQVDPRTVNRIEQGARILPPATRIAPSMDLADYLSDADELQREANRNRQQSLLAAPILNEED